MSPRNGASRKGLRLDGREPLRENAFDDGLGATVQAAVSPRSARPQLTSEARHEGSGYAIGDIWAIRQPRQRVSSSGTPHPG